MNQGNFGPFIQGPTHYNYPPFHYPAQVTQARPMHFFSEYNSDYSSPPPPRPVYSISDNQPHFSNPHFLGPFPGQIRPGFEDPYINRPHVYVNGPKPIHFSPHFGIGRTFIGKPRLIETEQPKRLIDKLYSKKEIIDSNNVKQIDNQQNENYIPSLSEFYKYENEQDTKHAKKMPLKVLNEISESICKIMILGSEKENWNATGFFMKFQKGKEKTINLLITNSHVIPQDIIDSKNIIVIILGNGSEIIIELDNEKRFIKCLKTPIDITAIEILDTDEIDNNIKYLSYDLNYEEGYQQYINADVFSLQHPLGNDTECASGKIIEICSNNNFEFIHSIDTNYGSSGSPVILVGNSRVIGIHKSHSKKNEYNKGTFIGALIKEIQNSSFKTNNNNNLLNDSKKIFNNNNKNNNTPNFFENKENEEKNKITPSLKNSSNILVMQYKINVENKIRIFGDEFVKNNQDNCRIIINGINLELCKYIDKSLIEGDKLEIHLKEIKTITNMSHIF